MNKPRLRSFLESRWLRNLQVMPIGLGTARTFDVTGRERMKVRRQILEVCAVQDVNFVDTSPMYGRAEEVLGVVSDGSLQNLQWATKVWCRGRENGEVQIARSFRRLRTNYISVLQIHNLVDWQAHLPTLERLKEEQKIGLIGITHHLSSHYPEMIEIMKGGQVDTIQIPYNVFERSCEEHILPLAQELGIGVIVMKPLDAGTLAKGKGFRFVQRFARRLRHKPDLSPLVEFGIKTWGQALLSWVLADPRVSVVIPATRRPDRITENAAVAALPLLPQELREYIQSEADRCV